MGGLRSSVPLGESLPGLLGHKLKYDGWRVACLSPRWGQASSFNSDHSLGGGLHSFFPLGQLYTQPRITWQERILLTTSSRYINQEAHVAFIATVGLTICAASLRNFLAHFSVLAIPRPRHLRYPRSHCYLAWMVHTRQLQPFP